MVKKLIVLVLIAALLAACAAPSPSTGTPDAGSPAHSLPEPERVPEPPVPVVVIPPGSSAFADVGAATAVQGASYDYELQDGESFVVIIDAFGSPQLGVMDSAKAHAQAIATPMPAGRALEQIRTGLPPGSVIPLLAADSEVINDFLDGEAWAAKPCEIPIPPGVIFCPTPTCSYASCEVYADTVYVMPTGGFEYTDVGARWDLRVQVSINARRVGSNRVGVDFPKVMWLSVSSIRLVEGVEVYRHIVRGLRQSQGQTKGRWRLANVDGQSVARLSAATVVVAGMVVLIIIADGPTPDDIIWLVVLRELVPAAP